MDFADPAEHGDAVPALLPMPDHVITEITDGFCRKLLVWCLQLLKTDDIRLLFLEPAQQDGKAAVYAVHIIGGDLHVVQRSGSIWSARPQPASAFDLARLSNSAASPTCQWGRRVDRLHLGPAYRHGDWCAGAGPDCIGHDRGRAALIAQVVDENPALALDLWKRRCEVRRIALCDRECEAVGGNPSPPAIPHAASAAR